MSARKNALQAVLDRTAGPKEPQPAPQKAEPKAARTYREGKKLVSAHVPQEVHRELRLMAIEDDSDLQHLIEEAIDLLFVKKGKPPMFRHA
jgi:hypothetical protein